MYMHGFGVAQSHKKALEHFKAAAEKGNAEAQFNLGAMHIGGMGVKKAYDKALHFFTLSAHQGHTLALYNLGQMHLNGLGTPRSCSVAVQCLKAVAERGPWGTMLEEAHQALQGSDTETALQLYATLAEGGYEVAQSNVAFLLDRHFQHSPNTSVLGLRGDSLAARAHEMYSRAAQQGNVEAELKLGDYHYYGVGVGIDKEAAVHHYRAAAEARNGQAMFNLAYMYAHGLGLSKVRSKPWPATPPARESRSIAPFQAGLTPHSSQDYHLAKRHYDMASEAVPEAYPAVKLALIELKLLQMWDDRYGSKEGLYEYVGRVGPSPETMAFLLAWDTLLILCLTLLLGFVLALRMQR